MLPALQTLAKTANNAPNFLLPELSNQQETSLSAHKGQVIYLDFWASWCGPCRQSFPALNNLYQEFKAQGLLVIGINLDDDIKKAQNFLKKHPVDFKLLHDATGATPLRYEVKSMPSAFIIDQSGKIRQTHQGFKQSDITEIRKTIIKLLAEKNEL